MNRSLLIVCWKSPILGLGQNRNAVWIIQPDVRLDFTNSSLTPSEFPSSYGSPHAVISDVQGNMAFYFDGQNVRSADHSVMQGGSGESLWTPSWLTQQASLILPKPGSPDRYFLFTTDRFDFLDAGILEVDMAGNSGLGAVVSDTLVQYMDSCSNKVAATLHADGETYWVVNHEMGTDEFYSFHLTSAGLDPTPVISHAGEVFGTGQDDQSNWPDWGGELVFSPAGDLLALSSFYINYDTSSTNALFTFDNSTGIISYITSFPELNSASGVEFSPLGTKLYWCHNTWNGSLSVNPLVQFDVSTMNASVIQASITVIPSDMGVSSTIGSILRLAPDGKIYLLNQQPGINGSVLSVIHEPDQPGVLCGLEQNAVPLQSSDALNLTSLPLFCKRYSDSEPYWSTSIPATDPASSLALYPNPCDESAILRYPGPLLGALTVSVVDGSGRSLRSEAWDHSAGAHVWQRKGLAAGSYILLLRDGANTLGWTNLMVR